MALHRVLLQLCIGTCTWMAGQAQAAPFELVYTGSFSTVEGLNPATAALTPFQTLTPFTIHATFDSASPNLAPRFGGPFNGFRAYAPSLATIDIAGTRYQIDSATTNPLAGVTVAIFDQNSFTPGRYGIGLIADPFNDGAGIVGDFSSASPDYTVSALTPTVYTNYFGVGHGSGVCLTGSPPACPHAVTPWVLHDPSGAAWNLTLGNFEEDYPVAHTPGAMIGPLNTAVIVAVPEPSTWVLMLGGLLAVAAGRRDADAKRR